MAGREIRMVAVTGSTNADVAVAGTVLVAEAQTAGRGGSGGPGRRHRVPGGRLPGCRC